METTCQHCTTATATHRVSQHIDGHPHTYVVCDACLPSVSEFADIELLPVTTTAQDTMRNRAVAERNGALHAIAYAIGKLRESTERIDGFDGIPAEYSTATAMAEELFTTLKRFSATEDDLRITMNGGAQSTTECLDRFNNVITRRTSR